MNLNPLISTNGVDDVQPNRPFYLLMESFFNFTILVVKIQAVAKNLTYPFRGLDS